MEECEGQRRLKTVTGGVRAVVLKGSGAQGYKRLGFGGLRASGFVCCWGVAVSGSGTAPAVAQAGPAGGEGDA